MELQFELKGVDGLIDRMSKLTPKLQQATGRKSARRAMAIVRDAARERVRSLDDPESPQRIWKNVYIQQSRRQSAAVGGVVMRVGILGGARQYGDTRANRRSGRAGKSYATAGDKGNPGGDTWYWRFLEFGTRKMDARPFLLPALVGSAQSVLDKLTSELNNDLDTLAAER